MINGLKRFLEWLILDSWIGSLLGVILYLAVFAGIFLAMTAFVLSGR